MRPYKAKEVAERFGVCARTIYRRAERGELPCLKFGNDRQTWRFPRKAIDSMLEKASECRKVLA